MAQREAIENRAAPQHAMTPPSGEMTPVPGEMTPAPGEKAPPPEEKRQELPDTLRQEIEELGGRADEETWRDLLLRLCRLGAWTADELADLTDRKRKYIVRQYLTPMVEEGLLVRTQRSPHDPRQRYKAADSTSHDDPSNA